MYRTTEELSPASSVLSAFHREKGFSQAGLRNNRGRACQRRGRGLDPRVGKIPCRRFSFWPLGMWDLNSLTGDQTCTPCIER